jgi:HD-GYP domain-containing protein (c-di-GMP phosphodiesterase class II)
VALDSTGQYTSNHCRSAQKISEKIGRVMGMDLSLPALLHDVGKIHVPNRILIQGGPLNAEERTVFQQHPYHSFRIVCPINPEVAWVCLRHHERPDGKGYPLGENEVRNTRGTTKDISRYGVYCFLENPPAARLARGFRRGLPA